MYRERERERDRYIYIYIYIYRERERDYNVNLRRPNSAPGQPTAWRGRGEGYSSKGGAVGGACSGWG